MSLVKTLAKVAIGVAVAKGVSYVARNGLPGGSAAAGDRSARNPGRGTQIGGSGDILGQLGGMLGGAGGGTRGASGGLGSLIEGLSGGIASGNARRSSSSSRRASAPKGIEDLLGGGLGGLLGGLVGGAASSGRGTGGLGPMLDSILTGGAAPAEPSREQELAAGLMLKAMIQAVKADQQLDAAEKQKLMQAMQGASEQEVAFVNQELSAPVDIDGLVAQVPQGKIGRAHV